MIFNAVIFLLGLAIGSFLNVLICRISRSDLGSIVHSRSKCPTCRHILSWLDLFPVFSFLFLKGRCRYCRKKISFRYPIVEIITGISFLSLFLVNAPIDATGWLFFALWACAIAILTTLFFVDLEHFVIPDKILIVLGLLALPQVIQGDPLDRVLSGFSAGLFFLVIYLATKGKALGLGDVKLIFILGLLLGFPGILIVIYGSLMVGTLWGVVLITFFGAKLKTKIPFGTVLSGVTIFYILFNKFIIPYLDPYILRLYL